MLPATGLFDRDSLQTVAKSFQILLRLTDSDVQPVLDPSEFYIAKIPQFYVQRI
jgi:hypothetical protein